MDDLFSFSFSFSVIPKLWFSDEDELGALDGLYVSMIALINFSIRPIENEASLSSLSCGGSVHWEKFG